MFILIYFFRSRLSWNEASKHCRQIGGHLPFLKYYHEKDFTYKMQQRMEIKLHLEGVLNPTANDVVFLGMKRKVKFYQYY